MIHCENGSVKFKGSSSDIVADMLTVADSFFKFHRERFAADCDADSLIDFMISTLETMKVGIKIRVIEEDNEGGEHV